MARLRKGSNRRDFLKTSAVVVGGGFFVGNSHTRSAESKSPNERIRLGCIGVGGKGGGDTDQAAELCDVVALCDCDEKTLGGKAEKFSDAKKYTDYRKMFDELGKNIDAVTISTPDHNHAPAAMRALRNGIHTYVQKPLTHTVFEARQLRETAAKNKCATQMGNQGSAENGLREAVEVIQSGAIGPIREAHIWTNRPVWQQAPDIMKRPDYTDPVPSTLDWEAFIGPAPMRPFVADWRAADASVKGKKRAVYHPFAWRGWWDFGTGALGDMGCHTANMSFRALKLRYPTSIEAKAGDVNPETCPSFATVTFEFPAREDMPACKVVWHEGKVPNKKGELVKNLPSDELLQGQTPSDSGSLIVGDKGTLYSPNDYGAEYVLMMNDDKKIHYSSVGGIPKPKKGVEFTRELVPFTPPSPTLPRNGGKDLGMKKEWVAAIRGGAPAYSNFDVAGLLTEFILLGNVAIRAGKKLEWDGENCKVTNCPEAAQYINKEYRKGWEL